MSIVAKKRGGAGTRGGARESGCGRRWKRVVPLAVLVVLAAVVAWRLADARKRVPPAAGNVAATPERPAAAPAAERAVARPECQSRLADEPPALQEVPAAAPQEPPPQRIVPAGRAGYYRMPDGTEFRFRLPPEGQTASLKVKGVLYRFDSEGNFTDISKPKVFDNPVENQLVGLSVEGGSFAPGLMMRHSDEDIAAALRKPVVINEDDPDDVREKKEAVAAMKREILAYMEQGGTYEDFVTEMASMARQERKMKRDGIRKIVSMLEEGRADEARDFYETYNRLLQESGYSALKLQMGLKERMGLE